jgi:formylglycine-generating enzyme required for sulfatase activity
VVTTHTLIMFSLGTVFLLVGALAWMVDAGLGNNAKRRVKYALFALMFAAITPLYFVEDNSEFEYRDWTPKQQKAARRRHAGGGGGGFGGGNRASLRQALSEYEEESSGGGGGQSSGGHQASQAGPRAFGRRSFRDCRLCPVIVHITSGKAMVGSPSKMAIKGAELGPARVVTVERDFGIGKYEVTVEQFHVFIEETGYQPSTSCHVGARHLSHRNYLRPGFAQDALSPAVCISWKDANRYTDWLSKLTGEVYRLPTEIEWEYAAHSGVTADSVGSAQFDAGLANFADKKTLGLRRTELVGQYPANANDIHDVQGNAWEMTADCWSDGYLSSSNAADGEHSNCSRRVVKGGGWFSSLEHLDLAIRVGVKSGFASNGLGFRVVREVTRRYVQAQNDLNKLALVHPARP